MWSAVNAFQFLYTAVWTVACITLAGSVYLVTRARGLALMFARRLWAPGLLAVSGARLRVGGALATLPQQPCVFVANHQSMLDIVVLFRGIPRPLRFVVKRELLRLPFVGWYIAAMGMVAVDRRAGRGRGAVDAMVDLLRSGSDVIAFPEGTRSRDGSIGTFRRGSFEAALLAGAPVVPVAIRGAGAVLPAGGFRARPGRVELVVGESLFATAGEDRDSLAGRAEAAVRELHGAAMIEVP